MPPATSKEATLQYRVLCSIWVSFFFGRVSWLLAARGAPNRRLFLLSFVFRVTPSHPVFKAEPQLLLTSLVIASEELAWKGAERSFHPSPVLSLATVATVLCTGAHQAGVGGFHSSYLIGVLLEAAHINSD